MKTVDWRTVAGLTALGAVLQLLAVLNPSVAELDPEEMYNAGHAWALAEGHWSAVWRLQYREFCGGCTGAALLGAPLFSVLPATWLTWKLVPIGFSSLLCASGMSALWRWSGPAAGVGFGVLVAFAPRAWTHLSLLAWGNHVEVGVLGVVALALALREERWSALGSGVVLGLALWWSFSAAAAVLGVPLFLALTGRWHRAGHVLAALPLGLLPWLLRYLDTGLHPFVTIYEAGESAPRLSRVPYKLGTLLAPRQLVALFGQGQPRLGWGLGWAFAVGLAGAAGAAVRQRLPVARAALTVAGVWVAIYVLVRFQVDWPPAPNIAGPGSARYFAPVYPLIFVVVADAFGHLWRARRRWALVLAMLVLPTGLLSRALTLAPPFPQPVLATRLPVDWFQFTPQFSYTLSAEEHRAALSTKDPVFAGLHSEALGWRAAHEHLMRGTALGPMPEGAEAVSYGRGVGQALVQAAPPQTPPLLPELRDLDQRLSRMALPHSVRQAARDEAAWLVVERQGSWLSTAGELNGAVLEALEPAVSLLPEALQASVWRATGRSWALRVCGPGMPGVLAVPEGAWPEAFWWGLGRGAGEEWGPHAVVPRPQGAVSEAAFLEGLQAGWSRSWRPPFPGAPRLGDPD